MNQIAGVAAQLKQVGSEEFKGYAKQIKLNSNRMCEEMKKRGYKLMTDGTSNHLILWDVNSLGLSGRVCERAFDLVNLFTNKNTIATDTSAFSPGGVRIGTSAVTARGLKEDDCAKIVEFFEKAINLSKEIVDKVGKKDFHAEVDKNEEYQNKFAEIKKEVIAFITQFRMPGYEA